MAVNAGWLEFDCPLSRWLQAYVDGYLQHRKRGAAASAAEDARRERKREEAERDAYGKKDGKYFELHAHRDGRFVRARPVELGDPKWGAVIR